jgi:hypothetical protein
MIRQAALIASFIVGLGTTGASAGTYGDAMSKCLIRSATVEDQVVIVKWMFSAFSLTPELASLSNVTPEQREQFNQEAANLMQRLVLTDCRQQTVTALKNEGAVSLQTSFSVLGWVATRGMMMNPGAAAGLLGMVRHFDGEKFSRLFDDAGVQPPIKFGE